MSDKEVCSTRLRNLALNYQQRVSEWGEGSARQPQLTRLPPTCRRAQESHGHGTRQREGQARTAATTLQEHTVFFQSKIQCISGKF